jgi:hypothetical protein
MEAYYYSLFLIFTILAVMIVIDANVGTYIILLLKILKVNTERFFWMIRFHPKVTTNPIVQWWMMRKYMKEVEKIKKEISK